MTSLIESIKKGPLMTMTLECKTEFPRELKDIMLSMGLKGEVVYKGFPIMDEGQEYWWVQLHLYENKRDDHRKIGHLMFTNTMPHTLFFESAGSAAWNAIEELAGRLRVKLLNTKKYLEEVEEELEALQEELARERNKEGAA